MPDIAARPFRAIGRHSEQRGDRSVEGDLCADRTAQKTLEVKAGEVIVGIFARMRRESRERACVAVI